MYKFSYYTEEDQDKVIRFMNENSFVLITGAGEKYPVATHIPIIIEMNADGKILLSGHLMKNTDHHKAFVQNEHVLVIFNGPHTFVSASWYTDPMSGSTWNYMTVHAKGKIKFTDEAGTLRAVKAISDKHEGEQSVAAFDKLPKEYIDRMVKAIVGFTIEVEELDNVFKLSQNRDLESQHHIVEHLKERGDDDSVAIAGEIEKRY